MPLILFCANTGEGEGKTFKHLCVHVCYDVNSQTQHSVLQSSAP